MTFCRARRGLLAAAAALLLPLVARAQTTVSPAQDVDAALAAAVVRAQATLPDFWAVLEKPGPMDENFRIRIRYATPSGGSEDVWAIDVRREGGDRITATIDGAPRDVPGITHGQRVTVPVSWLVDWFYFRDGRLHGAHSIRAQLPAMSRREADKYRAMLAPE